MLRIRILLVVGLLIGLGWRGTINSWADGIDTMAESQQIPTALDKLGRGVTNAVFGWLEIPSMMGLHYDERNTGGSLVSGFAYGIVQGVRRTVVGLFETVTFPFPIPEGYAPILPTIPYFDKHSPRRPLPLE